MDGCGSSFSVGGLPGVVSAEGHEEFVVRLSRIIQECTYNALYPSDAFLIKLGDGIIVGGELLISDIHDVAVLVGQ